MFNGIYTIVYAFFDAAGRLDRESMRRQVQACVAMGAHGIGILGLTTEVSKLSDAERRQVIDWTVSDVAASGRRIPIACTIFGNSVNAQAELATYAQQAGVDWLILQPPRRRPGGQIVDEPYCFDFFLAVMEQCALPVAIQNAPEYLGVGLSNASLSRLMQRASNFNVLKGEGSATLIQQTIAALGDRIAVLNGRGGLELPDQIRAGVAGMIVDPSSADWQVKVWNAMLPHGRQTSAVPVLRTGSAYCSAGPG